MSMISQSVIEDVKTSAKVVDVIKDFLPIKKDGRNFTTNCPFHEEKTPSFIISPEKNIWTCFGGCDTSGDSIEFVMKHKKISFADAILYLANKYNISVDQPKQYIRPIPNTTELSDQLVKWFKDRGISQTTLIKAKITESKEFMPEVKRGNKVHPATERKAINFNCFRNGELVNVGFRDSLKGFKQVKDAESIFFNLDSLTGTKECFITEGQIDCLTLIECIKQPVGMVSVPHGANGKSNNLTYVDNCISFFEPMEKIYIATDDDIPGRGLREALAERFGKERCYFITYNGRKDLNEVLVKDGAQAVIDCCNEPKDFPIIGVFNVSDFSTDIDDMFHNGIDRGVGIGMKNTDRLIRYVKGWITVITGFPTSGKALALDTDIPTPSGWKKMGELQVFDKVYDEKGNVCYVIDATDTMYDRPCYKIKFSDGSTVVCDAEHKWLTSDYKARTSHGSYMSKIKIAQRARGDKYGNGKSQAHKRTWPSVKTTEEISKTIRAEKGKRKNHMVDVCKAIYCKDSALPVDPYVLGAWLGDGHRSGAGFTSADNEIVEKIRSRGYDVRKRSDKYGYGILGITSKLRKLNLLYNKHIPILYLRASIKQRMDLLRGLMDTDGYVGKNGDCEFCNTNIKIAKGVHELASSLGIRASFNTGKATLNGRYISEKYRINFTTTFSVFSLKRKQKRLPKTVRYTGRYMVSCEKIDSVPVRCIEVDSQSHLYLCTKSFIPTHNSDWLDQIILGLMIHRGWKAGFYSPENDPFSLHFSKLARKLIGKPWYGSDKITEQEKNIAKSFLEGRIFVIKPKEDFSIDSILESVKQLKKQKGIDCFVIDAWNRLEHKYNGANEAKYVQETLMRIDGFCRNRNIHCFLVAHPTKPERDKRTGDYPVPTLYSISGGAHFRNICANGMCVHRDFKKNTTTVYVQKVKFLPYWGELGYVEFQYDVETGRYNECSLNGEGFPCVLDKSNWITGKQSELQLADEYPF